MSHRALRIVAAVLAFVGVAWIVVMSTVIGVLLLLAAAGCFARTLAGQPGASAIWTESRVLAAGFVGIVAALTLTLIVPKVSLRAGEVSRLEAKIAETKHTLESIEYDANGNVVGDDRTRFNRAIARAKDLPGSLQTARTNLHVEIAITAGATLVLLACGLVIARTARRRRAGAPRTPSGVPTPVRP